MEAALLGFCLELACLEDMLIMDCINMTNCRGVLKQHGLLPFNWKDYTSIRNSGL